MSTSKYGINFGIKLGTSSFPLKKDNWRELVSRVESLGFSGIFVQDHFIPQWDPLASMAGIAAVTKHIDVGSMVCCVDFRHPVVYAKASATINLISNNRHIFGIGAGWMKEDYDMSGIPFDKAITRVRRLKEAIQIIKGMWTQESTSFDGKYYQVDRLPKAVPEIEYAKPRLMIGGGRKMMLNLAGTYADIVNILVGLQSGWSDKRRLVVEGSFENLGKKVAMVRDAATAAGRDADELVYGQYLTTWRMQGDPDEGKRKLAEGFGASVDEISDCTWIMAGEAQDVVGGFKRRYEEYGITHYVIDYWDSPGIADLEYISEKIIKPLS